MSCRMSIRWALWVAAPALSLVAGCGQYRPFQPREHDSAKLLNSGPTKRVTARQQADVQVALGRSLEESGNLAEAEAAYRNAVRNDSRRADAEDRLAVLADRKGEVKESAKHFARARALEPKNPEILCDLGYSLYLQRRWAEAEECLRRAIGLSPGHARSHNNLGLVLARQEDHAGALAEFRRAGCDASDAQANLGLVLALEGNFTEARRAYSAALAAKPSSAVAGEGLRAATLALAGGRPGPPGADRALASDKRPATLGDPAVGRASALLPAR